MAARECRTFLSLPFPSSLCTPPPARLRLLAADVAIAKGRPLAVVEQTAVERRAQLGLSSSPATRTAAARATTPPHPPPRRFDLSQRAAPTTRGSSKGVRRGSGQRGHHAPYDGLMSRGAAPPSRRLPARARRPSVREFPSRLSRATGDSKPVTRCSDGSSNPAVGRATRVHRTRRSYTRAHVRVSTIQSFDVNVPSIKKKTGNLKRAGGGGGGCSYCLGFPRSIERERGFPVERAKESERERQRESESERSRS